MTEEDSLPVVNRMALVVEPTEAFLEWLSTTPDSESVSLDDLREECTVYLVADAEGELESILEHYYESIFEQELYSWYTDESFWPEDRSWETFQRFFEVRADSMVFDLGEESLESVSA